MAVLSRLTLGNVALLVVSSDPSGSVTAPLGSLALLAGAPGTTWHNTNGGTTWAALGAGGGGATLGVGVQLVTPQSITSATPTAVIWDTESYDNDTMWAASPNPERLTIATASKRWQIAATVTWEGALSSTSHCRLSILKNGTTTLAGASAVMELMGDDTYLTAVAFDDAPAVSDYYETIVEHEDFAAKNVTGRMWVQEVGRP